MVQLIDMSYEAEFDVEKQVEGGGGGGGGGGLTVPVSL